MYTLTIQVYYTIGYEVYRHPHISVGDNKTANVTIHDDDGK